ncbi:MAG: zinc ABC transporter substrate-binding protein [Hyphomicrobiales bacterium]|nr:MAG: zinc ABC transporter substrate-binding protein [Hyphomicrobiales bacterium]
MKAAAFWLLGIVWLLGILPAAAEPPRVVVTIKPIHSLVAAVMKDVAQPELLVTGQASPHTYSLKPSQTRALYEADVFFRVANRVDPFASKVAASLPGRVTTIALLDAPDLVLLHRRQDANFEAHTHADEEDHKHDTDDFDAHVWLDPANARAIARRITEVLGKRFPPFAAQFERNRAALDARLVALDAELKATTAPVATVPFAVYHDAYQYFEHRYGLKAVGSLVAAPDVPISGKRLGDVRRQVAQLKAACVFGEPQSDPRLLQAIVEGTNSRTGILDAEGLALEPGPDLYVTLMRTLARDLRACLLG